MLAEVLVAFLSGFFQNLCRTFFWNFSQSFFWGCFRSFSWGVLEFLPLPISIFSRYFLRSSSQDFYRSFSRDIKHIFSQSFWNSDKVLGFSKAIAEISSGVYHEISTEASSRFSPKLSFESSFRGVMGISPEDPSVIFLGNSVEVSSWVSRRSSFEVSFEFCHDKPSMKLPGIPSRVSSEISHCDYLSNEKSYPAISPRECL